MGADSEHGLPILGSYPVVLSDELILPTATLPVRIKSPTSIRALEEARKTDNIIFLSVIFQSPTEAPTPDKIFKVGTLCRVVQVKSPDINSVEGSVDFMAEGLERASALKFIEHNGFLSADIICDPTPDDVADEKQMKTLDQRVRGLLNELYPLLPKEKDKRRKKRFLDAQDFPISSHLIELFNVHEITSPSRLADHTAFLLHLLGLIPKEQKRAILETFRPEQRLTFLINILKDAVETRQFVKLLRNRATNFVRNNYSRTKDLAALSFIAQTEGKDPRTMSARLGHPVKGGEEIDAALKDPKVRQRISAILSNPEAGNEITKHAVMTRNRRLNYIQEHLLEAVDMAIASLYSQARTQIKQEISQLEDTPYESEERRKNRDADIGIYKKWASDNLGIEPEGGRKTKWDGLKLSLVIDEAMDKILRLRHGVGISYHTVAAMINKIYPKEEKLTVPKLKGYVDTHNINWREKKKGSEDRKGSKQK